LGILEKLKKRIMGDCPTKLIPLIGKPKAWRQGASIVLIEFDHRMKRIELMAGASIGLSVMILSLLIKIVLGG